MTTKKKPEITPLIIPTTITLIESLQMLTVQHILRKRYFPEQR